MLVILVAIYFLEKIIMFCPQLLLKYFENSIGFPPLNLFCASEVECFV